MRALEKSLDPSMNYVDKKMSSIRIGDRSDPKIGLLGHITLIPF
jgi:hypothetical protein